MTDVLVVAELIDGGLRRNTLTAVTLAKQITAAGGAFDVLAIGEGSKKAAADLAKFGARKVFATEIAGGYVAEKAETEAGWLFPVGDEVSELGYVDMFADMFEALDGGHAPAETFYDGYVVNAVMDACHRSAASGRFEPVDLEWRGGVTPRVARPATTLDGRTVIKRETLPDGRVKLILKDETTGDFEDRIVSG